MSNFLKRLSIPQTIVLAYAFAITCGAILLWLPLSSANGEWTTFIDALFTATSATAVTGQVTLNTAAHWNYFGKTVIITLIEIGGLGFMTIWILFYYYIFKQRPNLKQRRVVSESLSLSGGDKPQQKVFSIVRFALTVQLIGAMLLGFVFIPEFGITKGLYFSVFHSISAFCNAGFDLLGNSLIDYQSNPFILLVIASLIMSGGLGFIVWEDLINYRKTRKLRRYSKIVLITTSSLWILGTFLFWISEYKNGTFSHLSVGDQLANYFFLSVTPRTAGYANIDYANLSLSSIFLTIVLMFIGASSGSTGGGVKVTTLVVIVLVIYRSVNYNHSNILNRTISQDTVRRSFFIFSSGMLISVLATFILLNTETIPDGFGVEYILIEVFSCLGTVGLTMGLTPSLTVIGKIILILLMLIGRVGVMTFLWSLTTRKHESGINYPEMSLLVG
jgi:potassium uptake protein, TrkH family